MPVRLIIVEDEPLFRELLRIALARSSFIDPVALYPNAEAALDAYASLHVDCALLDIELGGGMNGLALGLELKRRSPEVGIVLLSHHQEPEYLKALPPDQQAGWAYLLKPSVRDVETLERAILGVVQHWMVLDPTLAENAVVPATSRLHALSERQRDILRLLAEGYTNTAIAQRLWLAPKSIENQLNALYRSLGLSRQDPLYNPRVQAVRLFLEETIPGLP